MDMGSGANGSEEVRLGLGLEVENAWACTCWLENSILNFLNLKVSTFLTGRPLNPTFLTRLRPAALRSNCST